MKKKYLLLALNFLLHSLQTPEKNGAYEAHSYFIILINYLTIIVDNVIAVTQDKSRQIGS